MLREHTGINLSSDTMQASGDQNRWLCDDEAQRKLMDETPHGDPHLYVMKLAQPY